MSKKLTKTKVYRLYDQKRIDIIKKHNLKPCRGTTGSTIWPGSSLPFHYKDGEIFGIRYYCSSSFSVKHPECQSLHFRDYEINQDVLDEFFKVYLWFIAIRKSIPNRVPAGALQDKCDKCGRIREIRAEFEDKKYCIDCEKTLKWPTEEDIEPSKEQLETAKTWVQEEIKNRLKKI